MKNLEEKKILVLGGANQHLKFVEAAKELGVYTIVTDYLPDSPCKRICNEALMLNITDIAGIVAYCRQNHVDGIVSGFLDPCQIPYAKICHELHMPCYGTPEQFFRFTNKIAFKELCKANGVDVIPDYTEKNYIEGTVEYPVFVKPVDSRGSRGQTVCHSSEEMPKAIDFAKKQSSTGEILIEQYMGDYDEVQITYFLVDGEIYLERTVDSNRGSLENHLQKVVNCSISPSKYTDIYIKNAHAAVCKMIRSLGVKDGPVFMQGFYKNGHFHFFDPGLRFPGVEFERIYKSVWGIDLPKLLIYYSLTGKFPAGTILPKNGAGLNGKVAAVFFPVIRGGRISHISGIDGFRKDPSVISCLTRYAEGEEIEWTYDVNQRYAEIDILGNDTEKLAHIIDKFYNDVEITNNKGQNMLFDYFNTNRLLNWYKNRLNIDIK